MENSKHNHTILDTKVDALSHQISIVITVTI